MIRHKVGALNYPNRKKPEPKPAYDPRKTTVKPKEKTVNKSKGGKVGVSGHNRLY